MKPESNKLLVIGHWPTSVTSRSLELARAMSKYVTVYWLDWDLADTSNPNRAVRLLTRYFHAWKRWRQPFLKRVEDDLTIVTMPYLLTKPYSILPDKHVWSFNKRALVELVRREGISHILNANARFFPTNLFSDVTVIYDVVDDHAALAKKRQASIVTFMEREVTTADFVISISHALCDIIQNQHQVKVDWVPNGGSPERFNNVSENDLEAIRKKWGLCGKRVIGCIGNHNSWTGTRLLIDAHYLLRNTVPDAVLFLVGPGTEIDEIKSQPLPEGVIVTGFVPPSEIGAYFRVLDVGTLPFIQVPFTDNAFPIKIIEYGMARTPVVASPLKELVTLDLPHITLVERTASQWAQALQVGLNIQWQSAWDRTIQEYTWQRIAANSILKKIQQTTDSQNA